MSRFGLALLALAVGAVSASAQDGPLVLEPFTLRGFDGVEQTSELGRLRVAADREDPGGGAIELAFVRLAATSERPGSPIVFLAGGPGVPGIVMGQIPVYRALFDRLRATGDVILLDQRGTGRSVPALDCPAEAPLAADVLLDEERALAALLPPLRACAVRLIAAGVDPSDYTTAANADDVDALREALGAERVRLLGFSYGTEVALAYARRHGERVERLVLVAVRPPWAVVKLPSAYDRVVEDLSALAARDPAAEIPDFAGSLRRVVARLSREPLRLTIADRSGAPVDLVVGPVALQAILQGGIADGRSMPRMVATVAALDRGESEPFRREVERFHASLSGGIGLMGLAMNCSAGAAPERRARASAEAENALLGGAMNLLLAPEACAIVGTPDLGPGYREPVRSEAPALFVSGSLDPNAPPDQAAEAAAGFSRAVHVVVANGGHETLPADEVQTLVAEFLAGADVAGRTLAFPAPRFPGPTELLAPPAGP